MAVQFSFATEHKWSWQEADVLELNENIRGEVYKILKKLNDTLAKRDPEYLIELQTVKLKEVSRAFHQDESDEPNETRAYVQSLLKRNNWAMKPLDTEMFDLRLCANRRMVDCIAKDWQPILRDDKENVYFDVKLSKIKGKIVIVR